MSKQGNAKSAVSFVKKTKTAKQAIGKPMSIELAKEQTMGDYLRLFLGNSNGGIRREVVIHRPIGITDLASDEWVLSPVGEVSTLLSRRKDPYHGRLEAEKQAWLAKQLIAEGLLKENPSGEVVLPCGNPRGTLPAALRAKWKAQNPESKKFDVWEVLKSSPEKEAQEEIMARDAFAAHGLAADKIFVSSYRTRSGPNEDIDQCALGWAKGLPLSAVADTMVKHGISGPPTAPLGDLVGVAGPVNSGTDETSAGRRDQWCFLPSSVPPDARKEARNIAKALREFLAEAGVDVKIYARPVESEGN
jgi:hypothetical protein